MNRLQLIYRMDDLLKNCETCEIRKSVGSNHFNPKERCTGCTTYKELRGIGTQLEEGTKVKLKNFTVEEYRDLKAQGLNDRAIADKKEVTAPTLTLWKKNNLRDVTQKPKKVAVINTTTKPQGSPQNELKDIVSSLKRKLEVREKAIEDLKVKLEGSITKEELDKLRNGWDEELAIEREKTLHEKVKRAEAEREYDLTRKQLINLDAEYQNTRDHRDQAREEAVRSGREAEALRRLVRLYMPEEAK